jgi:oxalate decarboxylase/phosphoglucose isomerase-like protein (cupin superfamily)
MEPFADRTHTAMKEVLMDPSSVGPDVYYYVIRGGSEKKNITVWEIGAAGEEYIKTYGHYHVADFLETYEVLSGEGIILLQERKKGADGKPIDYEIEKFTAVFLKKGSVVPIPKYAGHLAVNTGESWLVTIDDSPVKLQKNTGSKEAAWPEHADYSAVKKMQGFAYYVVKKDGKPSFVKNPKYKNHPEIIIEQK